MDKNQESFDLNEWRYLIRRIRPQDFEKCLPILNFNSKFLMIITTVCVFLFSLQISLPISIGFNKINFPLELSEFSIFLLLFFILSIIINGYIYLKRMSFLNKFKNNKNKIIEFEQVMDSINLLIRKKKWLIKFNLNDLHDYIEKNSSVVDSIATNNIVITDKDLTQLILNQNSTQQVCDITLFLRNEIIGLNQYNYVDDVVVDTGDIYDEISFINKFISQLYNNLNEETQKIYLNITQLNWLYLNRNKVSPESQYDISIATMLLRKLRMKLQYFIIFHEENPNLNIPQYNKDIQNIFNQYETFNNLTELTRFVEEMDMLINTFINIKRNTQNKNNDSVKNIDNVLINNISNNQN